MAGFGRPSVLLLGDSLTQFGYSKIGNWVATISDALQRKCDVVNRGYSGYNTKLIRQYLPQILNDGLAKTNAATVIFLGTNDAKLRGKINNLPEQHVPLPEFVENMKWIIEYLNEAGIPREKILVVPVPPCDEEAYGDYMERTYGDAVTTPIRSKAVNKDYHEACIAVAREKKCEVAEGVWEFMDEPEMFCDGLHFSELGSDTIAKCILPAIETMTKGVDVSLPDWKDLKGDE